MPTSGWDMRVFYSTRWGMVQTGYNLSPRQIDEAQHKQGRQRVHEPAHLAELAAQQLSDVVSYCCSVVQRRLGARNPEL